MPVPTDEVTEVSYRCPNCEALISIADEFVGQTVDCPRCSVPFEAQAPVAQPILKTNNSETESDYTIQTPSDDETVLETARPALFRKHPVQLLTMIAIGGAALVAIVTSLADGNWSFVLGAGVVLLLIAGYSGYRWVQILATSLTITNKRTRLRHGIISKKTSEVQHDDVRNLQVDQTVLERFLGIGDLAISSSGQDDLEIIAIAIPQPNSMAELIRRMQ
ncbi:Bacterial membrane flanked domain protein [Thalassoglobus neptunius]|uniref:Bacterial membrane flanked domain protein n=1 Tax=Thalassoglobus neptunius TaxID=1938619 RepID=A0A5C5X8W3_9PLAN|nr:PH domain-containing protein [Thalassoglobus neptunius]TWT59159.1 Bacterial membrane flanked domain protein [Thalassoglobus neptunius]